MKLSLSEKGLVGSFCFLAISGIIIGLVKANDAVLLIGIWALFIMIIYLIALYWVEKCF